MSGVSTLVAVQATHRMQPETAFFAFCRKCTPLTSVSNKRCLSVSYTMYTVISTNTYAFFENRSVSKLAMSGHAVY